jgi:hypothetical protein
VRDRQSLFSDGDLHSALEGHRKQTMAKVDELPQGQFVASDDATVTAHVMSVMNIEPIAIYEDRAEMTQNETTMDVSDWYAQRGFPGGNTRVPAIRVVVTIPFTGDADLFKLRPQQYTLSDYCAEVRPGSASRPGQLAITIEYPAKTDPKEFKEELDRTLSGIRSHIAVQKNQIEQFLAQLPDAIKEAINRRRKRLEQHDKIRNIINIPMPTKPGAVEPLDIKRNLVVPLSPAASPSKDYQIDDATFEHILKVIRHEGATMETARETFFKLGEEELRDMLLAHLNGHYQGGAKGEAFRGTGKTDISIERENRAAFVAECKLWKGGKQLSEALDQLLGYLTWRDGKTALVLFNKDAAGFAEIQAKLPDAIKSHPRHVAPIAGAPAGEWRFRFKSKEDDARLVTVHVFLFSLFVSKDRR